MSYLARLKQLDGGENFTHSLQTVPPKLTKGGYGGFVSTVQGAHVNISAANATEKVGAGDTAQPIDPEAREERAAICEFDGGLSRADAELLAWQEDDRQRCSQCQNYRREVCTIAKPGGVVSANRGYRPWQGLPRRCEGFEARQGMKLPDQSARPPGG
jgi:hypothetical protein